MVTKKKINYINELQDIQRQAVACPDDVGIHSPDGDVIIDAKSYIGMYALDFAKPILIVSDDPAYHEQIHGIGENVE